MSNNLKEIELDEATTAYLLDVDREQQKAIQEAVARASQGFEFERSVIVNTEKRRAKILEGKWEPSPDRKKLIRTDLAPEPPDTTPQHPATKRNGKRK